MKVLMLKDVKGVARRDEMKEVSDGYAINFLIAQGLAVQATPEKIAQHEARQKIESAAHAAREAELRALVARVQDMVIEIPAKANATGHLYTQLSSKQIIDALKKEVGEAVPHTAVLLSNPIKQVGESDVSVKCGAHTLHFKVNVMGTK
jgi:large subunit ribosomal protein L9